MAKVGPVLADFQGAGLEPLWTFCDRQGSKRYEIYQAAKAPPPAKGSPGELPDAVGGEVAGAAHGGELLDADDEGGAPKTSDYAIDEERIVRRFRSARDVIDPDEGRGPPVPDNEDSGLPSEEGLVFDENGVRSGSSRARVLPDGRRAFRGRGGHASVFADDDDDDDDGNDHEDDPAPTYNTPDPGNSVVYKPGAKPPPARKEQKKPGRVSRALIAMGLKSKPVKKSGPSYEQTIREDWPGAPFPMPKHYLVNLSQPEDKTVELENFPGDEDLRMRVLGDEDAMRSIRIRPLGMGPPGVSIASGGRRKEILTDLEARFCAMVKKTKIEPLPKKGASAKAAGAGGRAGGPLVGGKAAGPKAAAPKAAAPKTGQLEIGRVSQEPNARSTRPGLDIMRDASFFLFGEDRSQQGAGGLDEAERIVFAGAHPSTAEEDNADHYGHLPGKTFTTPGDHSEHATDFFGLPNPFASKPKATDPRNLVSLEKGKAVKVTERICNVDPNDPRGFDPVAEMKKHPVQVEEQGAFPEFFSTLKPQYCPNAARFLKMDPETKATNLRGPIQAAMPFRCFPMVTLQPGAAVAKAAFEPKRKAPRPVESGV